jgi:hypothetical protein
VSKTDQEKINMADQERWRPVVGYEGLYEVSDTGRVRSLGRVDVLGRPRAPRLLTLQRDGEGYLKAVLTPLGRNGVAAVTVQERVNVLVLEAFVGPRPNGHDSCHENDIPDDNRLANLRWGTRSENHADAARNRRRLTVTNRAARRGTRGDQLAGHCVRGHRLIAPNLTNPHPSRGGVARCLACQRGHNTVKDARRLRGLELDVQVEADRIYADLMAGVSC